MKRSLSWLFAALLFTSCGGGDDGAGPGGGNNNHPPTPQPTAVGSPDGGATSQTIGVAGGVVISEDSLFTVTIPAGALSSDTLITVQPITNEAWGGVGRGYRLTPQGLQFNVPVSLAFKVAPQDLKGSSSALLDVAVQDEHGVWYILKNSSYESATGTFTATSNHFSDYTTIEEFQIRPASATVKPQGTVDLDVKDCVTGVFHDPQGVVAAVLYTCLDVFSSDAISNWSVDGAEGGSAATGTVAQESNGHAVYIAPANVPLINPVAVSAEAESRRGDKTLLVSNITIAGKFAGDVNRYTGTGAMGENAVWHMTWTSNGAVGNIETFNGTGTIDYTPQTLPCPAHTFSPTHATVSSAYMIIDRRSTTYTVTVGLSADWDVHECDNCNGNVICTDYHLQQGFGDGGTGRISETGDIIYGDFKDPDSLEEWHYVFVLAP